MDIGNKMKTARAEAHMTQEQAAEALGVSRQTISNWENEKSYPDIISVLKMSDLYHVSLDYLLKGEINQNGYMQYLDESTNLVKSKDKLSKLALILSYLIIWAIAVIVFWCFMSGSDAMGFSLIFLWIILPITTFTISLLIGRNNYWKKAKWLAAVGFGIMYMLAEYSTSSMANNLAFQKVNIPDFTMLIIGVMISLIGLGIGQVIYLRHSTSSPVS